MLLKEKNLSPENIRGKKIRWSGFYGCLLYLTLFFAGLMVTLLLPMPREAKKIILPLYLLPFLVMLIPMFVVRKKILCILADDRLYFFSAEVVEDTYGSAKKKRSYCGGSVGYSDILDMKYFPYRRSLFRRTSLRDSEVILYGADFQIIIRKAGRYLIWCIKQKNYHQS